MAGILLGIAVGCCVLIGLVTFYAARADLPTTDDREPTAEPEPTAAGKHQKVTDVRLPRHLSPELYTLELVPFIVPDNFTIRGNVEIQMLCNEASNNVTLHVADILVENSTVTLKETDTGREIRITGHDYDKDREFYISKLGETLQPGKKYSIKIAYTAYLKDNLKGFYRSVYKDQATGKDEYITEPGMRAGHIPQPHCEQPQPSVLGNLTRYSPARRREGQRRGQTSPFSMMGDWRLSSGSALAPASAVVASHAIS